MTGSTFISSASQRLASASQRLDGAGLLDRAAALRPALLARQAETERLRRLPAATMAEFHAAGILRAIQPVAFGGFEADFLDLVAVAFSET